MRHLYNHDELQPGSRLDACPACLPSEIESLRARLSEAEGLLNQALCLLRWDGAADGLVARIRAHLSAREGR